MLKLHAELKNGLENKGFYHAYSTGGTRTNIEKWVKREDGGQFLLYIHFSMEKEPVCTLYHNGNTKPQLLKIEELVND